MQESGTYNASRVSTQAWALASVAALAVALWVAFYFTGLLQVLGFTAFTALLVSITAREVTHPITWFAPVFWLYSVAYPLLALAGLYSYDETLQEALALHSIALAAFATPLFACRSALNAEHWRVGACRLRRSIAWLGVLVLAPIILLLMLRVVAIGATTKRELLDSGSFFLSLLSSALLLLTFLFVVALVLTLRLRKSAVPIVLFALAIFVPLLIYAGERDYLLRSVVVFTLAWWDFHRRPKPWRLVVFALMALMLLPLLQSMKSIGLGGGLSYSFQLASIIGQEFRVMTQNTQIVLDSNVKDLLGSPFASLAMDLKRAMLPQVLGFDATSTTSWFNEVVLFDIQSGRGFSLVACGYLLGGFIGVALLYALIGAIFRILYVLRSRSYIHLTGYLLGAPLLMYVQRGDLSAFIGPGMRAILLPAVIFLLVVEVARLLVSDRPVVAAYPCFHGARR